MRGKPPPIPSDLQAWIEARRRFHLSHAHVQMARELGLNPKKFGGIANHRQEIWKTPLPAFIERLYLERFGSPRPQTIRTIEEVAAAKRAKKDARRQARAAAAANGGAPVPDIAPEPDAVRNK
jgi:hypothetical protein